MADAVVLVDRAEGVVTITLNRPEKMNALNSALRDQLTEAFRRVEADDSVGVVILTGAGRAFCAGVDLKELGGEVKSEGSFESSITANDLTDALASIRKPVICAVNGVAVTGGFELALACDVLIAATEARFADTHARVGIMPGWGLSQRLSRAIGIYRAKELSLTGNYLSAEQAERWGLVNRVVPADQLLSTCRALAKDMLSCDPVALQKMKRVIDQGFARDFASGIGIEQETAKEHARSVRPEEVAKRRAAIQARGRDQKSES